MSAILIASGISYAFSNGRELFSDLNFSLTSRLSALVGPNGVGKTHLAKLLAGELEPSAGRVTSTVAVGLFAQRQLPQAVSVAEFLSGHTDAEWSLLRSQLLADIDPQALCNTLSGGQWTRVRLAHLAVDRFLILDEPTNDLDREGRRAVLHFLSGHEPGALVITHDRECLALCDDILELSNRGLAKFGGGWPAYTQASAQERENLAAALKDAKRERDRVLTRRAEQKARQDKRSQRGAASAARGGAPQILLGARKRNAQKTTGKLDLATLAKSATAIREVRAALSEVKVDPMMYVNWMSAPVPAQKLIAEAQEFNIRLPNERWLYRRDLNFTWRGNVRVAVKGNNGSGKSTLLMSLLQQPLVDPSCELGTGVAFETRGTLRRGSLASLYLDQHCSTLNDTQTVLENICAVSSASETDIRNDLARFLFAQNTIFQRVRELSGGERLRAALARGLLSTRKPELMVLDEPTNNLDLANVEFLEGVVREFSGALVIVSHDDRFLENCGATLELSLAEH